jgi:PAS domain S-box-containing protein
MVELQSIKRKLVNISLIIATIAGLPVVILSVIRSIDLQFNLFIYSHIIRFKLNYTLKSLSIILLLFFLSIVDFLKTGFQSAGYLWLLGAVILTALYFDLKRSIIALFFSIVIILSVMVLYKHGIITYHIDFNHYLFLPTSIIIKTLDITLIGLIIGFSIHHINKQLNDNITNLNKQKESLELAAQNLRFEAETRRKSELRAINNEKNFRNIFDQSSEALIILDAQGGIIDFNEAFLQVSGFSEKQMLLLNQKELYSRFIGRDDLFLLNQDKRSERFSIEFQTSDGKIKNIECNKDIIFYNDNPALLLMMRDVTEKMANEKANFLAAFAAEEKERARFSRELHDGLGPLLSTLKIYLEIHYSNPSDPEIRNRIDQTLNESIKTVKEVSNNLSPYILDNMGLTKAIRSFIEKVKFGTNLEINFNSNLENRLSNEMEISIYRFASELVNNTLKHAQATKIDLRIEPHNKELTIYYHDNGKGFDLVDPNIKTKGIGLHNMKSRIQHLGGKVEIITSPGNGFQVEATLPLT